jgi:hypothetical protein
MNQLTPPLMGRETVRLVVIQPEGTTQGETLGEKNFPPKLKAKDEQTMTTRMMMTRGNMLPRNKEGTVKTKAMKVKINRMGISLKSPRLRLQELLPLLQVCLAL